MRVIDQHDKAVLLRLSFAETRLALTDIGEYRREMPTGNKTMHCQLVGLVYTVTGGHEEPPYCIYGKGKTRV